MSKLILPVQVQISISPFNQNKREHWWRLAGYKYKGQHWWILAGYKYKGQHWWRLAGYKYKGQHWWRLAGHNYKGQHVCSSSGCKYLHLRNTILHTACCCIAFIISDNYSQYILIATNKIYNPNNMFSTSTPSPHQHGATHLYISQGFVTAYRTISLWRSIVDRTKGDNRNVCLLWTLS